MPSEHYENLRAKLNSSVDKEKKKKKLDDAVLEKAMSESNPFFGNDKDDLKEAIKQIKETDTASMEKVRKAIAALDDKPKRFPEGTNPGITSGDEIELSDEDILESEQAN